MKIISGYYLFFCGWVFKVNGSFSRSAWWKRAELERKVVSTVHRSSCTVNQKWWQWVRCLCYCKGTIFLANHKNSKIRFDSNSMFCGKGGNKAICRVRFLHEWELFRNFATWRRSPVFVRAVDEIELPAFSFPVSLLVSPCFLALCCSLHCLRRPWRVASHSG